MSFEETGISPDTQNIHRVIISLREELEAIDLYNQRADACKDRDASAAAIFIHNRNEEIEHAVMLFEWLRRKLPEFDHEMKSYLFTTAPVTEIEEGGAEADGSAADGPSLGLGKLR